MPFDGCNLNNANPLKAIFAIAKKMQLKQERRSSLKTQRGRPSWASSREGKPDSSDAENKRRRVE